MGAERLAEWQRRAAAPRRERAQLAEALHVRAAKMIDRLLGVAHEEEVRPWLCPVVAVVAGDQRDELGLRRVDVLRLVDHQVAKPGAHLGGHVRVVPQ